MGRRNTPREEPQRAAIPLRPESMPAAGENGSESELPASAPRPPVWRRPIGWLIALAVMLRLVSAPYLISEENPLFDPETFPNGDLIDNMQQARQVLERGGTPEGYFKHGPLYVYLLAGVMKATGGRFWWMYGLQLCAGVAGVALMYLAARRLIGEPGATAAGALAALYAPAVYYETVMTADALNPVVVALILYLGARYQTHPQASAWRIPVLLGLALGGLTMLRANLCLIGLALAVWLPAAPAAWAAGMSRGRVWRRRLGALVLIAGVSLITLIPVSIYNSRVAGRPRFVVGESNIIWQFSWSVDSPGYFYYPEGFPESELLAPTDPRVLALTARKLRQFFAWLEFPDLTNFHLYSRLSPPLHADPVTYRLVAPLGLIGLVLALFHPRRFSLLLGMFAVVLFAQILFYVSGRYRLTITPLLFLFAGLLVQRAIELIRGRGLARRRLPALAGIAAGLLAAGALVNVYDVSRLHSMWHSDSIFGNFALTRGAQAFAAGELEQARKFANRLMWLDYPEYQMQGHILLSEIARVEQKPYEMRRHLEEAERIRRARAALPVLDAFGNKHFPPST